MQHPPSTIRRHGITVLTLLLLIIAVVIAAVFLVRYLRHRPATASLGPAVELVPVATAGQPASAA